MHFVLDFFAKWASSARQKIVALSPLHLSALAGACRGYIQKELISP